LSTVPLATLVSASSPPGIDAAPNPPNPTLHFGKKRFFVVHGSSDCLSSLAVVAGLTFILSGGLFSKDSVTLEDIRKVPRKSIKRESSLARPIRYVITSLMSDAFNNDRRTWSRRSDVRDAVV